ncbi:MAG: glycine--tRNA ligase [Candidatus Magasanikbacteria bacterium]
MDKLEKLASLTKRRGFIYQCSEIYGGISGMWDYGPLGVEVKKNVKDYWWESMVQRKENIVGADGSIIMNPKVWEASGHLDSFSDPLVQCTECKKRFRADHVEGENCPECGSELGEKKEFNLLVDAYLGSVEGEKRKVYLRGEITQGAHVNFKQVINSSRVQVPFGIAQTGKAFRNEITPAKLSFRSREFEQMELQFYVHPSNAEDWMKKWKQRRLEWYKDIGFNEENIRFRQHEKDEMAHYARDAWDLEYNLGEEWMEFEGVHNRGDWDLKKHQEHSGKDFEVRDPETGEKFLPWIVETSGGVDRVTLFLIAEALEEEKLDNGNERTVLKFDPKIAPYKVAVFPLLSNKEKLVEKAREVYKNLQKEWMVDWDQRGNIGKRYRYQDEAGTKACVTIDFDTLEDETVTIRDRDTMEQVRVELDNLKSALSDLMEGDPIEKLGELVD